MSVPAPWNNDESRHLVLDILIASGKNLDLPYDTIRISLTYLEYYFQRSAQVGLLGIPLLQLAILSTFVASKTQETFKKLDELISAFVEETIKYQQNDKHILDLLGIDSDFLFSLRNPTSGEYMSFHTNLAEGEIDFMTQMEWYFPDPVNFPNMTDTQIHFQSTDHYLQLVDELSQRYQ